MSLLAADIIAKLSEDERSRCAVLVSVSGGARPKNRMGGEGEGEEDNNASLLFKAEGKESKASRPSKAELDRFGYLARPIPQTRTNSLSI